MSPGTQAVPAKRTVGQGVIDHPVARKSWPSCSYTQRSIEAAIALREEHKIDPASIVSVELHSPAPYVRVVSADQPATFAQARFSVRYCVSRALSRGQVNPADFEAGALNASDVQCLMRKISMVPTEVSAGLEDLSPEAPDHVVITSRSGECFEKTIANVRGGPRILYGPDPRGQKLRRSNETR